MTEPLLIERPCPDCNGKGRIRDTAMIGLYWRQCRSCDGTGQVQVLADTLTVDQLQDMRRAAWSACDDAHTEADGHARRAFAVEAELKRRGVDIGLV